MKITTRKTFKYQPYLIVNEILAKALDVNCVLRLFVFYAICVSCFNLEYFSVYQFVGTKLNELFFIRFEIKVNRILNLLYV